MNHKKKQGLKFSNTNSSKIQWIKTVYLFFGGKHSFQGEKTATLRISSTGGFACPGFQWNAVVRSAVPRKAAAPCVPARAQRPRPHGRFHLPHRWVHHPCVDPGKTLVCLEKGLEDGFRFLPPQQKNIQSDFG